MRLVTLVLAVTFLMQQMLIAAEAKGLVFYADYSGDRDAEIKVLIYKSSLKTVSGFRFNGLKGERIKVDLPKVKAIIAVPDLDADLTTPSDFAAVTQSLDNLRKVQHRFPSGKAICSSLIPKLEKILENQKQGLLQINGKWMSPTQAVKLAGRKNTVLTPSELSKIDKVLLPAVKFESAPLGEVLDYLSEKAFEHSQGHLSLNIVFRGTDEQLRKRLVAFELKSEPVIAHLKYVLLLARCKYEYETHAVVITPRPDF